MSTNYRGSVSINEYGFRRWKCDPDPIALDNGYRRRIIWAGSQTEAVEAYFAEYGR